MNQTPLEKLIFTKCAQLNVPREKQANIFSMLSRLVPKNMLGRIGSRIAPKADAAMNATKRTLLPAAATGVAAGGVGYGAGKHIGYGQGDSAGYDRGFGIGDTRGFERGDAAGYSRGATTGSRDATRNLFKGLMDLQQQGAKSESDLTSLMPKQGSAMLTHTQKRLLNIKMASAVLNIKAIEREMAKYNLYGLQKSAAIGANRQQRVKYAALIRQRELEKQAFLGGLARMGWGAAKGLGRMGWGASKLGAKTGLNAAKGVGGLAGGAISGAAKGGIPGAKAGMTSYAMRNPAQALTGTAATAMGVGSQVPGVMQGLQQTGQQAQNFGQQVGQTAKRVQQGVGNFANAVGQAGQDITGGFQQAGSRF